ncbi:maleylpyruvate isomerase family mycothiol-dependent enzyme [Streptomyces varsoviensis]|uniref:maleylpyruvate isomerase family mycothiol-dependent enzyme n=1 Tax=Streptomyces varsoviensis TaxID=67373 RepID=UPI0004C617BF|nr:maleylpyruvate isomerase family mycothiol-dependent enzyme [Streptomyces varsoviensis]
MSPLSLQRYAAEIIAQTDLLRAAVDGADPTAPVPTCPDWNLGRLLRHIGAAHRWADTIVSTRAAGPVPHDRLDDPAAYTDVAADDLGDWLTEGARALADTLCEAGPDAAVWTVAPGGTPVFWARRMTHETLVHRSDAALAAGAGFTVAEEVGLDALDEWMDFGTLPQVLELAQGERELLGPGRTLHLHATDVRAEEADRLIDLTRAPITWSRTPDRAAVTVRGPLTDLVLALYRRPARGNAIEIIGDASLFDLWLDRTGAWLQE